MSYFFHSQPLLFCLSPGVGGVHGDMIRNIWGSTSGASIQAGMVSGTLGAGALRFTVQDSSAGSPNAGYRRGVVTLDASYAVPTGAANKPRAWGALACAYLGQPA